MNIFSIFGVISWLAVVPMVSFLFHSNLNAADRKTEGRVHFRKVDTDRLRVSLDPGFHFNIKAPAFQQYEGSSEQIPPVHLSEKKLIFQHQISPTGGNNLDRVLRFNFYVCDNARTVCELHEISSKQVDVLTKNMHASSKEIKHSLHLTKSVEENLAQQNLSHQKSVKPEFIQALEKIRRQHKWLLLDFGASWCPACIRMEKEVLTTSQFQKVLNQKYELYRVDVDRPENYELMRKYHIKAFPSFVIINDGEEELARFLDYQSLDGFVAGLNELANNSSLNLKDLEQKTKAGDKKAAARYAQQLYLALKYMEADAVFVQFGIKSKIYFLNKINLLAETLPSSKEDYEKILREAIMSFPEEYQTSLWKKNLAESLGDKSPEFKELLQGKSGVVAMTKQWIESPEKISKARLSGDTAEIKDLEVSEMWSLQAEAYKMSGDFKNAKGAWEKAVESLTRQSVGVNQPTHLIYLVYYLKEAGQYAEADSWLRQLQAAYPQDFTYPHRRAKLFFEQKKWSLAEEFANKSYGLAYGSNRLTVGLLLAKIYLQENKEKMGKSILKELAQDSLLMSERNKKIKKEIEDMQQGLQL